MARARGEPAAWLFQAGRRRSLTRDALIAAELAWQPLASVRLSVAQFSRAGQWHLAPGITSGSSAGSATDAPAWACARACRAAARGQEPRVREARLLDAADLCAGCVAGLTVPGPEGTYVSLAWWILAAQDWVTTLELTAPSADWLACARWAASTPFTEPCPVPALLADLPDEPGWADCAATARAAWDQMYHRAEAAWEHARQAAGPPGYRAVAACARSLATTSPHTRAGSFLIAAITGQAVTHADAQRPWRIASDAWHAAVSLDGNLIAGRDALHAALELAYWDAPVRDLSLLPAIATTPDDQFHTLAEWAQADYRILLTAAAVTWTQRLEGKLAQLLAQQNDPWLLLLVLGWPLTDTRDQDLAYLASYPEHARIPDPRCGLACGRRHQSWAVILHVPAFAATHALTHDSAHHHAIPGPQLPVGTDPTPEQLRALLRQARDLDDDALDELTRPDPAPSG